MGASILASFLGPKPLIEFTEWAGIDETIQAPRPARCNAVSGRVAQHVYARSNQMPKGVQVLMQSASKETTASPTP